MLTWEDLCNDKVLSELPYKIELTGRGQIIMSPTSIYHGNYAYRISSLLDGLLPGGEIITECAVETADGVREADTAWCSLDRWQVIKDQVSSSVAPEICVEVLSPSNSLDEMMTKRSLYIAAGAKEYWLCNREGEVRFFDGTKELEQSVMCPAFPKVLPKRG